MSVYAISVSVNFLVSLSLLAGVKLEKRWLLLPWVAWTQSTGQAGFASPFNLKLYLMFNSEKTIPVDWIMKVPTPAYFSQYSSELVGTEW